MATFITDAALKTAIASGNAQASSSATPGHLNDAAPAANTAAYNRIRSVLFNRGFTAAQIAAWDEGEDWNTRVGVVMAFWAVSKGDEDRGEPFRREYESLMEELKDAAIIIGGEMVNPSGAGTRVSYGSFDTCSDVHTMEDVL